MDESLSWLGDACETHCAGVSRPAVQAITDDLDVVVGLVRDDDL
jgi:hypothetical protein